MLRKFSIIKTALILTSCFFVGARADERTIKSLLENFVSVSKPNRSVGSKGHEAAYAFLKSEFQKLALKTNGHVYEHDFLPDVDFAIKNYKNDFDTMVEGKIPIEKPDYKKWKDFTDKSISFVQKYKEKKGLNLILEFKGTTLANEVIYVGAHYDTITHDHKTMEFTPDVPTAGADDNGSAIAALLFTATSLAETTHDRTLRFVVFDYEEIFFLGSYALAKDLKDGKLSWAPKTEKIRGLFNLEMIGWSKTPISKKPVMKIYTRNPKDSGAQDDLALAKLFESSALKIKAKIKPQILQNGFNRSDNWSFWQNGLASICITEDWEGDFNEKNYHTNHDDIKTLNLPYLAEITSALIEATASVLNSNIIPK